MLNFAGSSSASSNAQAQRRVARWVSEDVRFQPILAQDQMAQVMVSEVACTDEGCVPLETLVIVVSRDARWLGKLLVLGATLGCLAPAATIAATMSHK